MIELFNYHYFSNMKTKKIFYILLLILFFLSLIKTDYRLINEINCCGDDFEYFIHAQTIAVDRDFDYRNQILDSSNARFSHNDKIAPSGFVGAGLLSSPFYYIGYIFDKFFVGSSEFNFVILFYSFSAIFYLFSTLILIIKSIEIIYPKVNYQFLTLFFFGTGISYYAFERYSMTHVYEAFTSSLIIFLTLKFSTINSKSNRNLFAFLIPFSILIGILCRWTNYYLYLLPIVVNYIYMKKFSNNNKLLENKFFYISIAISVASFMQLSKLMYGVVTYNPQFIYSSNRLDEFIDINMDFVLNNIKNTILIFTTNEFGILWTAPCIAISILICIVQLLKKKNILINLISLLIFLQVFSVVLIWSTTASSYGYRYLYSLIPYSIFYLYSSIENIQNTKIFKLLIGLSMIGLLSYVFFETTTLTQLNVEPITNSFGKPNVPYSQPFYLTGVLRSIIILEAYLKIFANGFLVALGFKILLKLFSYDEVIYYLELLNLPIQNQSFQDNLSAIISTDFVNIILFLSLNISLVLFFIYLLSKKNQEKKKNVSW